MRCKCVIYHFRSFFFSQQLHFLLLAQRSTLNAQLHKPTLSKWYIYLFICIWWNVLRFFFSFSFFFFLFQNCGFAFMLHSMCKQCIGHLTKRLAGFCIIIIFSPSFALQREYLLFILIYEFKNNFLQIACDNRGTEYMVFACNTFDSISERVKFFLLGCLGCWSSSFQFKRSLNHHQIDTGSCCLHSRRVGDSMSAFWWLKTYRVRGVRCTLTTPTTYVRIKEDGTIFPLIIFFSSNSK